MVRAHVLPLCMKVYVEYMWKAHACTPLLYFFSQNAHAAFIARRYSSNDTKVYEPMLEPKKYHWAPLYVIFIQGLVCRIILAIAMHFKDRGRMSKPPICRWQKLCGQGKQKTRVDKTHTVRICLVLSSFSMCLCEFVSLWCVLSNK